MKINFYILIFALCVLFFTGCKESDLALDEIITIEPDTLIINKSQYPGYWFTAKVNNEISYTAIWSSSNPEVATVNEKGFMTIKNAGVTEIVVTRVDGKGSAKCKVKIIDGYVYRFRLVLKDKGPSAYTISKPEEFLSLKSIARRNRQNISIDDSDFPITSDYIKEIEKIGVDVVARSKWLKTVTVNCPDISLKERLKELPFVEDVILVWQGVGIGNKSIKRYNADSYKSAVSKNISADSIYYGMAWGNINKNNGQILHEKGYKGAGIDIAVIDAAFNGITANASLGNINIKGAKSFIYEDQDPYGTYDHGIWTLSCMAANKPGYYVGTAPDANYWLLRSEDMTSEFPVEQDYWVAAIEYADSVGVDMVNTSLYYTTSQFGLYKWENMDGKTELSTRGANMAAGKGIFIVCCAGNESSWVGTPGDSPHVLTVGGINGGTSSGMTVDGRIKPDVVTLAYAAVINTSGYIDHRFGTSYSSPIICGLAACLWQANPTLTNKQLMDIIKKSADRSNDPQLPNGYGIPDMQKALQLTQMP